MTVRVATGPTSDTLVCPFPCSVFGVHLSLAWCRDDASALFAVYDLHHEMPLLWQKVISLVYGTVPQGAFVFSGQLCFGHHCAIHCAIYYHAFWAPHPGLHLLSFSYCRYS